MTPVPFRGIGLAGRLWTLALVLWSLAALAMVAFIPLALSGSWSALAAAGLAWLVSVVALSAWTGAALAAAAGLGALARPVLVLGVAAFGVAGLWAAASLDVTGERTTVLAAAVVCLLGCAACGVAWWRQPRSPKASSP
jgi:hypothetical protein